MCLKQSFSHSKWVLEAILALTDFSNCVFGSPNFDTAILSDCTKFCSIFFRLLNRKFNEDSQNVLKTVIFLLQVGFKGNFVPDCFFKLCLWQFKFWHRLSHWLYWFFRLLGRKFNGDSKNAPKTVIFSLQVGIQAILALAVFSNSVWSQYLAVQTLTPLFYLTVPNFVVFFSGYWIGNLMRIPKICLKQSFSSGSRDCLVKLIIR